MPPRMFWAVGSRSVLSHNCSRWDASAQISFSRDCTWGLFSRYSPAHFTARSISPGRDRAILTRLLPTWGSTSMTTAPTSTSANSSEIRMEQARGKRRLLGNIRVKNFSSRLQSGESR